jgi:hypothetical protein
LIAVLVVFVAVGGYGYHLVHKNPGYLNTVTVGFVGPRASSTVFSNYRGLLVTEEVSAWYMATPEAQQQVRAAGGTAQYNVALSNSFNEERPDYGTPYVIITTSSLDPSATVMTYNAVMKVLANHLHNEQVSQGAPQQTTVTLLLASPPTGPIEQGGSHKRSLAGVVLLALLLALFTASMLERCKPSFKGRGLPIGRARGQGGQRYGGGRTAAPGGARS